MRQMGPMDDKARIEFNWRDGLYGSFFPPRGAKNVVPTIAIEIDFGGLRGLLDQLGTDGAEDRMILLGWRICQARRIASGVVL